MSLMVLNICCYIYTLKRSARKQGRLYALIWANFAGVAQRVWNFGVEDGEYGNREKNV